MTVLPNGLRVGSIHSIGHISAVGVFIHMGSRFEEGDDMGASHFLDSLSCMVGNKIKYIKKKNNDKNQKY